MKARRRALAVLLALVVAWAVVGLTGLAPTGGPATAGAAAPDPRPNIVLINADDMRIDELRAMPNVQRLIQDQGTTFSTSYAPFPLCCPARAAWLTGQYNHNNGVMGNGTMRHPEGGYQDFDTTNNLATWLDAAGYQTAMVGKFMNGYEKLRPPVVPPGWDEWRVSVGGPYYRTQMAESSGGPITVRTYNGPYSSDLYDDVTVDVLSRRLPGDAPVFLWVSHYPPHGGKPGEPDDPALLEGPAVPDRFRDLYAGATHPTDPSYNEADTSDKPRHMRNRSPLTAAQLAALEEFKSQRLESLQAVDQAVANIVRALQASGELDNTVLAFTSDNGYMAGEHRLLGGKVFAYEPSARVPLLIRGPGFPAGAVRTNLVANIDLAPTFTELADTTPGVEVDGRSLLPLAGDPASWRPRTLVLEAGPNREGGPDLYHGIRTARYKYLRHSYGGVEFYDLRTDPYELNSLTDDPAQDATQARLAELLDRMEDCAGADCR